jgi:hypothetical protein
MAKPFTKMILGGSIKVSGKGDTYKDPAGNEKMYEKSSIKISMVGMKQPLEMTSDMWKQLQIVMQDSAVKEKLKDWV